MPISSKGAWLGGFGTLITSAEARVDKAARPVIGDTMFSHSLAS